jgi:hypothetical protein
MEAKLSLPWSRTDTFMKKLQRRIAMRRHASRQFFSGALTPALLCIFLLSPICLGHPSYRFNKPSLAYDDPVGYQLISLVLEAEAVRLKLREIDIVNHTVGTHLCKQFPSEFQQAGNDMMAKSTVARRFGRKFSLKHPYNLVYEGGFEISEPGFDSSRTHAAIHVFRGCGSLCGGGSAYLFRRTENGWQKIAEACEEVS